MNTYEIFTNKYSVIHQCEHIINAVTYCHNNITDEIILIVKVNHDMYLETVSNNLKQKPRTKDI